MPSGRIVWQLDYGVVDGKRKMRSFATEPEAQKALDKAQVAVRRLGEMGLTASPVEMADFLSLQSRVQSVGATLHQAVEFFMQHGAKLTRPALLSAVVEDFVWSRQEANRSVRTVQTYRATLRSLVRVYPLLSAHELTRDHVEKWLGRSGWQAKTRNTALGHVRSLYSWACRRGHATHDPCDGVELLRLDREEIHTLSPEQARRLLQEAVKQPRLMPYVALGMFCGVRRAELERMRWAEVSVAQRTVIVLGKNAKTRARRVIDLPEAAVAWLTAAGYGEAGARPAAKRVAPANLKRLWKAFWPHAGLPRWPSNALRHTFASMHHAHHRDEAKLQALMGHESAEVLHQNYRALRPPAEAAEFWALRPP